MSRVFSQSIISVGKEEQTIEISIWTKYEIALTSSKVYDNPIYDVKDFRVTFIAPSGRKRTVGGFWDGGTTWRVRFLPDETGKWSWKTECSDVKNKGLHNRKGMFFCTENGSNEFIEQRDAIRHEPGKYYLSYSDGTPFFWLACTAWNGALKSTEEEWEHYLNQRKKNNYSVIQLVTTEWRGCEKNAEGLSAFEGAGYFKIHPEFIQQFNWWELFPANEILAKQPGEKVFNHRISVVKSPDNETIIAYIPEKCDVTLFNPGGYTYSAQWFNPVTGTYSEAKVNQKVRSKAFVLDPLRGEQMAVEVEGDSKTIEFVHNFENDMLIVLKRK